MENKLIINISDDEVLSDDTVEFNKEEVRKPPIISILDSEEENCEPITLKQVIKKDCDTSSSEDPDPELCDSDVSILDSEDTSPQKPVKKGTGTLQDFMEEKISFSPEREATKTKKKDTPPKRKRERVTNKRTLDEIPCIDDTCEYKVYNLRKRPQEKPNYKERGRKPRNHIDTSLIWSPSENFDFEDETTEVISNTAHKTGNSTFQCNYCQKPLSTYKGKIIHEKLVHKKSNHTSKLRIKKPIKDHDGRQKYECRICKKKFNQKVNMELHQLRKHAEVDYRPFECDLCGHLFMTKDELKRHILRVHLKEKTHQCKTCQKKFVIKSDLKQHIERMHHGRRDYECRICKKRFYRQYDMEFHQFRKHAEVDYRPFECDICGYSSFTKYELKIHVLRIHLKEKTHKCKACHKKFVIKFDLKRHIDRMHHGRRDYKCRICKKRFHQKYEMELHQLRKHAEVAYRPFKCEYCGYTSFTKYELKIHVLRIHLKEKNHKCKACHKKFFEKGELKRHNINVHHYCTICQEAFDSKAMIRIHIKNH